jgi:hypothetical protein
MTIAGVHLFDWLLLLVLLNGFLVGWNRGFPGEWPRLVMWLLIVGLGRLLSPLMAELVNVIGLTWMGGALCGLFWTVVIMRWVFDAPTRESGNEPQLPHRRRGSLARPLGGAMAGVLRYAMVLVFVLTTLAILPGGVTRFMEFRRSVLQESLAGTASRIYWENLSFEHNRQGAVLKPAEPSEEPSADSPEEPPAEPAD